MKLGISLNSSYRVTDVRDGAKQMLARTRAAATAGLDSLFVGDHHVMPVPYYQNVPVLARLLAEWDARDAGALFLLPLWNPVLAAEQIATLACLKDGRFIMQCGLGRDEYQFNAMGTDIRYRPSAFEEALSAMKALWRGESVTCDHRYHFQDARISPVPPEPIDVWIGASAPVAIDRAARIGDAWLAEPGLTPAQAGDSMRIYRDALDRHGRPHPKTIAIRRDVYVARDADDALHVRSRIESRGYRGFSPQALVIGEPDEVAASLLQLGDIGFTDVIVRNLHPEPGPAIDSTLRLAEVKALLGAAS